MESLESSESAFGTSYAIPRNFSSFTGSLAYVMMARGGYMEQISLGSVVFVLHGVGSSRSRPWLPRFLVRGIPVPTVEGPSLEYEGYRRPAIAQVFCGGRNLPLVLRGGACLARKVSCLVNGSFPPSAARVKLSSSQPELLCLNSLVESSSFLLAGTFQLSE